MLQCHFPVFEVKAEACLFVFSFKSLLQKSNNPKNIKIFKGWMSKIMKKYIFLKWMTWSLILQAPLWNNSSLEWHTKDIQLFSNFRFIIKKKVYPKECSIALYYHGKIKNKLYIKQEKTFFLFNIFSTMPCFLQAKLQMLSSAAPLTQQEKKITTDKEIWHWTMSHISCILSEKHI